MGVWHNIRCIRLFFGFLLQQIKCFGAKILIFKWIVPNDAVFRIYKNSNIYACLTNTLYRVKIQRIRIQKLFLFLKLIFKIIKPFIRKVFIYYIFLKYLFEYFYWIILGYSNIFGTYRILKKKSVKNF